MRRSLLCLALLVAGCGSVDVQQDSQEALKILSLSPRSGATGVALDAEVVVVFSDQVALAEGESALNSGTFYVEEVGGSALSVTPEVSTLDPDSTVFLSDLGLTADTEYQIVVASTVNGSNTEPMGVEVRSSFRTVAP